MKPIVLARCALLAPFVEVLNDIGAPTERMLTSFGLPPHPQERPNDYFPLFPAIRFGTVAQASQGIVDFGFHAVQRLQIGHLSELLQNVVRHAPTLLVALQQWCKFVQIEDTFVRYWLERQQNNLRICSSNPGTEGMAHLEHPQWVQNVVPIAVVRLFAGPNWAPATIAFEAHYSPSKETQSFWPNTRFLSGQKSSWIDVPFELLGLTNPVKPLPRATSPDGHQPIQTDIVTTLKLLLPSYLDERLPTVAELAEIARTSPRTLQRALRAAGLTYSQLLDQVRFDRSAKLLRTTDIKIIDLAFAMGYAHPSHFVRAFRRIAGVAPREFRANSQAR